VARILVIGRALVNMPSCAQAAAGSFAPRNIPTLMMPQETRNAMQRPASWCGNYFLPDFLMPFGKC
jgi:hypothetical protein